MTAGFVPEAVLQRVYVHDAQPMEFPGFHTHRSQQPREAGSDFHAQLSSVRESLSTCFSEVNPTSSPSSMSHESNQTSRSFRKLLLQKRLMSRFGDVVHLEARAVSASASCPASMTTDPADCATHVELPAHLEAGFSMSKGRSSLSGKQLPTPRKGAYGGVLKRKVLDRKLPSSPLAVRKSSR